MFQPHFIATPLSTWMETHAFFTFPILLFKRKRVRMLYVCLPDLMIPFQMETGSLAKQSLSQNVNFDDQSNIHNLNIYRFFLHPFSLKKNILYISLHINFDLDCICIFMRSEKKPFYR